MRKVKWCNVWNWTQEEGGTTRLHLTNDGGLEGKTLCGRTYPRCKGYPVAVRYCKTCVKKSKLTYDQIFALDLVPSATE